jgi:hypothetical protein
MKMILIVAATILTGGILFSSPAKNIKGTWRVQTEHSNCADQIIRIRMDHGIWKGTTDLPAKGKYDVPIRDIQWENDSLILATVDKQFIKVKWADDTTMNGIMESESRKGLVKLSKQ